MTAASPASAPLVLATTADLDVLLAGIGIRVEAAASRYQDTTEVEAATLSTDRSTLTFAAARLAVERRLQASPCGGIEVRLRFRVDEGSVSAASCAIDFTCERWSTGHYVLMPAAVYNGNRYGRPASIPRASPRDPASPTAGAPASLAGRAGSSSSPATSPRPSSPCTWATSARASSSAPIR